MPTLRELTKRLRDAVLQARGFDEEWPLVPPLHANGVADLATDSRWQAAARLDAIQAAWDALEAMATPPMMPKYATALANLRSAITGER